MTWSRYRRCPRHPGPARSRRRLAEATWPTCPSVGTQERPARIARGTPQPSIPASPYATGTPPKPRHPRADRTAAHPLPKLMLSPGARSLVASFSSAPTGCAAERPPTPRAARNDSVKEVAGDPAASTKTTVPGVGRGTQAAPRRRARFNSLIRKDLNGGGGGSRTRVRERAGDRPYRFSPTWCFAPIVEAGRNRPRLVRLISPSAPGPRARGQPTFVTLCPTAVGG